MKKEYSLAHLTVLNTTPLELAKLAYEAGYDYVSIRQIYMGVTGEKPIDLTTDLKALEELEDYLRKTGLKVLDIELAKIFDGVEIPKYESAFKIGKRLGARHVLCSIWTENIDYAIEKFKELCDLAKKYDLTIDLEAVPVAGVRTLKQTIEVLKKANKSNAGIMIDTHHFHRAQDNIEELKKVPTDWFHYSQICDASKEIPSEREEMIRIMREGRDYLGEGGINVAATLNSMPIIPYSIELPNSKNCNEFGALEHAKKCLETAKKYCDKYVTGRE